MAASMSTAPSGQAAIPGPSSRRRDCQVLRHRPRSDAPSQPGSACRAHFAGRLTLIEGRFADMDGLLDATASRRSTAWCSISASPRCSSTRRSAAFPSQGRAARHAHERRGSKRGRCRQHAPSRTSSPASSGVLGEEPRSRAPSPAPSRKRATKRRSSRRWHLCAAIERAPGAAPAGPHPSGHPHLPGPAHPCEPRTR